VDKQYRSGKAGVKLLRKFEELSMDCDFVAMSALDERVCSFLEKNKYNKKEHVFIRRI
jgi:hypothetical protein